MHLTRILYRILEAIPPPLSFPSANREWQVSFERQRLEIAALHSAEEKAAAKTSRIRKELGGSEQELEALEREMREISMSACVLLLSACV